MTLRLRRMRDDEFPAYQQALQEEYAQDIERNGGMPKAFAQRKAERDTAGLFPDGLSSAGVLVYVVEDANEEPVGNLTLGEREINGRQIMLVYDLVIDEGHRSRGFGREAMRLAEEEAHRRGRERIELNVFAGNEVARNLYRSLGYGEFAVYMGKDVE